MNKLRVCVLSPLYHPSLGGLGRQAQLLTEKLEEEGVSIFVIARRMKEMPSASFSKSLKIYRAWSLKPHLHTFENVNPINILVSLTFSVSSAFILFRKRKEYDIVHSHGAGFPLFINLPLLKLLRKRVIAKVASSNQGIEAGSLSGRHFGIGNLMIRILRKTDIFVATSSEIEQSLSVDGIPPVKIKRISNFVDFRIFSLPSEDTKRRLKRRMNYEDCKVVTFSGRFIQCKGIDYLLRAWNEIHKRFEKTRLILLGSGLLFAEMKTFTEDLGIADSVDFKGHINRIEDILHATDIFVLPSLHEGMPNSLLEAMACGLPAVATKIGGVMDIIKDHENGILVEAGNYMNLADGIGKLLENEELAGNLGSNAYKTVRDFYSLDSTASKYMKLYRSLLTVDR